MRSLLAALVGLAVVCSLGPATAGGKGTVVDLDGLKSTAPTSWKQGKAASKFRAYQFALPAAQDGKEAAELVIFYFGKGGGGGTKENLKRWQGMMEAPRGKSIDDLTTVKELKVGKVPVTVLDVKGTYLSKFPPFAPNAKVTRKADYRLIGVIFDSENGPYFMRLTGPAATIEGHKKEFDRWLQGFK